MLRWKCSKCNLTWIYPVDRCIHCKGAILKKKASEMKVIGVTKVSIPSPMHPIVPYNVLLLEDEHGNRMPRKTIKDYSIGDKFIEEKAKTENAVSIVRVKYDVYDAIENALELINFNVEKNSKVLVKPSIVFPAYPYQGINTNPKTVDAIIKFLLNKNIKHENIVVAEQIPCIDAMTAAEKSGILDVCRKNNVKFFDLGKERFEERNVEGNKFVVSKEVFNKDIIINVPALKTHSELGIAGALKNMIRIVDNETQKEIQKNICEFVGYMNKMLKYITVGDATIGMHGNGPLTDGEPASLNLILASRDAAALDMIFCEIGCFEVPDYIKAANKIMGNGNLGKIEVVGNEIDAVKYPLKAANKKGL